MLSFIVSPEVAKIIRSEVEIEMSESDFFGDIMWDIGLREKRYQFCCFMLLFLSLSLLSISFSS